MESHDSLYSGTEGEFVRNSEEGPPRKVEIHKGPGGWRAGGSKCEGPDREAGSFVNGRQHC
jgi:hypothetical protein